MAIKVGDYVRQGNKVVLVELESSPGHFWILYCQHQDKAPGEPYPVSGGGSGRWTEDQSKGDPWKLVPLTDPREVLRASLSKERDKIAQLRGDLAAAESRYRSFHLALSQVLAAGGSDGSAT